MKSFIATPFKECFQVCHHTGRVIKQLFHDCLLIIPRYRGRPDSPLRSTEEGRMQ